MFKATLFIFFFFEKSIPIIQNTLIIVVIILYVSSNNTKVFQFFVDIVKILRKILSEVEPKNETDLLDYKIYGQFKKFSLYTLMLFFYYFLS